MKRILLSALLLVLPGCDLIEDYTTIAEGRVITKTTGEPVVGVFVAIADYAGIGTFVYKDSTRTDAQGRYYLQWEGKMKSPMELLVNDGGGLDVGKYDNRYASGGGTLRLYERNVADIYLRRLADVP